MCQRLGGDEFESHHKLCCLGFVPRSPSDLQYKSVSTVPHTIGPGRVLTPFYLLLFPAVLSSCVHNCLVLITTNGSRHKKMQNKKHTYRSSHSHFSAFIVSLFVFTIAVALYGFVAFALQNPQPQSMDHVRSSSFHRKSSNHSSKPVRCCSQLWENKN